MRATGIVRRIDDLGRVVIPKEIRRSLHIQEGDPLEIFTDSDGGVTFKRYLPYDESEIDNVIHILENLEVDVPFKLLEIQKRIKEESK